MKLVGDVGGTKTLLALADEQGTLHQVTRYTNDDHAGFASVVAAFLGSVKQPINGGCFAVAGPVDDDGRHAVLTNRGWDIDCPALEAEYGLSGLTLINDFAGAALGITATAADQLVCLQPGEPIATAPRLVLGAGTGLGVALLMPMESNGKLSWKVIPGEGGHIGFSPRNAEQDAFMQWLRPSVGRVINEHILSGMGIAALDAFLRGVAVDDARRNPEEIAAQPDEAAAKAMAIFAEVYGAVAGDLSLMTLPRGGVYLAGGIAAKNLPLMQAGHFTTAYNAKGGYQRLTQKMPVFVVSEPNLGALGAAVAASTTLNA